MVSKVFKWSNVEKAFRVVEIIAVIVGLYFVAYELPRQLDNWRYSQEDRSFDILLRMEDRMLSVKNQEIYYALETRGPIFVKNKGEFTPEEVEQYLNDLISIIDARDRGLISTESIYGWFSGYFVYAYQNSEVQDYITSIRADGSDYYGGFEEMSLELMEYDKK